MSTSTRPGAPTETAASRRRALRRALVVDLRLNADRFGGTLVTCGLFLLLSVVLTDAFAGLLPLWAALAWYRYGRADTVERKELRVSLGMSRADRVRGRVTLIALESLVILLVAGAASLLATALGNGSSLAGTMASTAIPSGAALVLESVITTLGAAVILLLVGIWVGGDCLTHRPGRSMAVLSVLLFGLTAVLGGSVLSLPLVVLTTFGVDETVPSLLAPLGLLVVVVLLALLLRARMHAWIRQLDSGARQRLEPSA
ncbi:hypothetical protein [Brachybacterium sacelli]|uniref:ABC transporter permease n=1 Tax=Brachybacterium sacelli TaxID=173364 RepID=A0ABS4X085_9MICO|nr:hypothetical protein [Brachybacterium sacelli]MBP2381877.1 hypothetical protein [Brachybacterium sacelli]